MNPSKKGYSNDNRKQAPSRQIFNSYANPPLPSNSFAQLCILAGRLLSTTVSFHALLHKQANNSFSLPSFSFNDPKKTKDAGILKFNEICRGSANPIVPPITFLHSLSVSPSLNFLHAFIIPDCGFDEYHQSPVSESFVWVSLEDITNLAEKEIHHPRNHKSICKNGDTCHHLQKEKCRFIHVSQQPPPQLDSAPSSLFLDQTLLFWAFQVKRSVLPKTEPLFRLSHAKNVCMSFCDKSVLFQDNQIKVIFSKLPDPPFNQYTLAIECNQSKSRISNASLTFDIPQDSPFRCDIAPTGTAQFAVDLPFNGTFRIETSGSSILIAPTNSLPTLAIDFFSAKNLNNPLKKIQLRLPVNLTASHLTTLLQPNAFPEPSVWSQSADFPFQQAFDQALFSSIIPVCRSSCIQKGATEYMLMLTSHHNVNFAFHFCINLNILHARYYVNAGDFPDPTNRAAVESYASDLATLLIYILSNLDCIHSAINQINS